MNVVSILRIRVHGYWHAGGGRSAGNYLDALCERDGLFPVLPGRQLKGLLRQAVRRAEEWHWLDDIDRPEGPESKHVRLLFGSATQREGRHATFPGVVRVDSGRLPAADRRWLQVPSNVAHVAALYDELFSTAIDENGSAKAHSLRGIEVAVPVPLEARLELSLTAQDPARRAQQAAYLAGDAPWRVLEAALPLLDHIGAHRNRGLGECEAQLTVAEAGHA